MQRERDWIEYKNKSKKGLRKKIHIQKITSSEIEKENEQQQHYPTLVHVKNPKMKRKIFFV